MTSPKGWQSYDEIATEYRERVGSRFDSVARALVRLVRTEGRLLDVGTGAGAVVSALRREFPQIRATGCDISVPMLRVARSLPGLDVCAADAIALPFRNAAFDVLTASCVLSHIHEYRLALLEWRRVLRRGGKVALTAWGPTRDEFGRLWDEVLSSATGRETIQSAVKTALPQEALFSEPKHLGEALREAGFLEVRIESRDLSFEGSVEDYLRDREITTGARAVRSVLGETRWREFLDRARQRFGETLGGRVNYSRALIIGVGTAP